MRSLAALHLCCWFWPSSLRPPRRAQVRTQRRSLPRRRRPSHRPMRRSLRGRRDRNGWSRAAAPGACGVPLRRRPRLLHADDVVGTRAHRPASSRARCAAASSGRSKSCRSTGSTARRSTYGFGVTPLVWRWNFEPRGQFGAVCGARRRRAVDVRAGARRARRPRTSPRTPACGVRFFIRAAQALGRQLPLPSHLERQSPGAESRRQRARAAGRRAVSCGRSRKPRLSVPDRLTARTTRGLPGRRQLDQIAERILPEQRLQLRQAASRRRS